MKVKIVKIAKVEYCKDFFYYEVFLSKKKKFFGGDIWISEHTFFPSQIRTDEETKRAAIEYADNLLIPKEPIKYLKMDEIIYEKSNKK